MDPGTSARLDRLTRRRRPTGDEADELVALYRQASTELSAARSTYADPSSVGRLSQSVARARATITGAHSSMWADLSRFALVSFPAAAYRARWWWLGVSASFVVVVVVGAWWVAANPDVQASIASPEQIRQLADSDFASYYSQNPAASFAAKVWTNNAWIAAMTLVGGALLCLPAVWVLWQNALNVAVVAGLMASVGRLDVFFALITPHGLLELTAVFLAGAAGIRLGWQVVDPGPRPRAVALAAEGRAAVTLALGLAVVLFLSGLVEAFVTPAPWPTWIRVGVGALAWAGFLAYALVLGRGAVRGGDTGDLVGAGLEADQLPYAA